MMPKHVVLLLSGGLDSVTLLYDLKTRRGCEVHCALFDYGQKHSQELTFAKHHCHRLGVMFTTLSLPQLKGSALTDGSGSVIVPNRNAILLSHAVNLAAAIRAESVCFAANKDDENNFPDCRIAFVQALNNLLTVAEIHVEVRAPYWDTPKWQIVALAREMGVDVAQTWSCYRGGAMPCGECEACKKREAALGK